MSRFDEDPVACALISQLYTAVGAFFCNTRRAGPRICLNCTGPANTIDGLPLLCGQCRSAHELHGSRVADLVVPLAYVKGRMPSMHQSAHHVRGYKAQPPAVKCAQDLQLMAGAATYLHGRCIASFIGHWQAVTFVPSADRPGGSHPVADIAWQVHRVYPTTARVRLDIGPGFESAPTRVPRRDRFILPADHISQIADKHVLVVDDTWVSGDKAQSAAITLKTSGAARVTILCLTRWLRYDWQDHRELIDTLTDPYDATRCPVTGASCPPNAAD